MAVADVKSAPTRELGTSSLYPIPSWGKLTASAVMQPLEHVPDLLWPRSVRETFPRMRNDTQLSGLYRGTTLPILRYVWGVDPNGARPEITASVCAELGLQTIDQAWKAFQTGQSEPTARSRNNFSFARLQADALKACYLGDYFFEQLYDVAQDGPPGLNGGWFAHLRKLAPRAPWTISQFYIAADGGLTGIRQMWQRLGDPPIPVSQLVAFIFDQDPGDWVGNSLFRPCFREWLTKDQLYRIDTINHEKAGGILLTEAPEGSSQEEIDALGAMSANLRVGGGGSVPGGSNPVFLRATGSDVIASINQRDEAMARAFLMMFMSLGTSSSGGNRALSESFVDWFAIAQEAIAIWFQDVFNEHVIKDFVDLNWAGEEYLPRLVFKRPEDANPLDTLAQLATDGATAGTPAAVATVGADGKAIPVTAGRLGPLGAVVLSDEDLWALRTAHAERERDIAPARTHGRPSSATSAAASGVGPVSTLPLPDRPLRRQPTANEVAAAVDFRAIDENWKSQVDRLVAEYGPLKAAQIEQLAQLIENAGGDLSTLTQITALEAGADTIAARLIAMAHLGVSEALAEAARQGVTPTAPEMVAVEAEATVRASAVARMLSQSLSVTARNKAIQLTGPAVEAAAVAVQVHDYLEGLSDIYLSDQFSGALSAAQNGGRLAAMDENKPERYYISALLDVNCCDPCAEDDGREFDSAEALAQVMPAGGNASCKGGPRCRCTGVAIYAEAAATS